MSDEKANGMGFAIAEPPAKGFLRRPNAAWAPRARANEATSRSIDHGGIRSRKPCS